jgi:hypothetical protein
MTPAGLPHSGIDGAMPACGPPSLFAACHALHRPVSPRHPPHTGSCLRTMILAARQNSDHVPRDLIHRSLFNCQGATPCGAPIIISARQTHGKTYTTSSPHTCRTRLWAQGRCPADPLCPGVRDLGELQPPGKPSLTAMREASRPPKSGLLSHDAIAGA